MPVCAPTAISGVIGAVGSAMEVSQSNKAKIRQYKYKDQLRVKKAMRDDLLYKTKKVRYEQNVDSANIGAQQAYTDTQISLNKAFSQIFLKNFESMQEMMGAEGNILTDFASRGVQGANLAKAMMANRAKLGLVETARARSLMEAGYDAKRANMSTQIKLKDVLNKEFSAVALTPVRDLPEPPPVLGNPGMTFALGAGKALASGFAAGEFDGPGNALQDTNFDIDFTGDGVIGGSAFDWGADYGFTNNWTEY